MYLPTPINIYGGFVLLADTNGERKAATETQINEVVPVALIAEVHQFPNNCYSEQSKSTTPMQLIAIELKKMK